MTIFKRNYFFSKLKLSQVINILKNKYHLPLSWFNKVESKLPRSSWESVLLFVCMSQVEMDKSFGECTSKLLLTSSVNLSKSVSVPLVCSWDASKQYVHYKKLWNLNITWKINIFLVFYLGHQMTLLLIHQIHLEATGVAALIAFH